MPEEIRKILEAAIAAPSGENVQPWRFDVRGSAANAVVELRITHADHSLYGWGERASYVSAGAALENLHIAAAAAGYAASIAIMPDASDPDLAAAVRLTKGHDTYGEGLAPSIRERTTNRKKYDGSPLTSADKTALLAAAAAAGGEVRLVDSPEAMRALARAGAANERIMLGNRELYDFFFAHVNWTKKQDDERTTGFFVDTLELPLPARLAFTAVSKGNYAAWMRRLRLNRLVAAANQQVYASASAMGLVVAPHESPRDAIQSGRAMQRVWLEATRRKLSLQPMTGVLYFSLLLHAGADNTFSAEDKRLIAESESILRSIFSLGKDQLSYFMFRIGRSSPPTARASRFPVDRLATYHSP